MSDRLRTLPVGRWFLFASIVGALVLVAGTAATLNSLHQLDNARDDIINVIDPATMRTLDLTLALSMQEGSARTFALTQDPQFADNYRRAVAAEEVALRELNRLVPDDRTGLQEIARTALTWRTEYAEKLIAGAPPNTVLARHGAERMSPAREALSRERTTLERRHAAAKIAIEDRAREVYLAIGVVLAVIIALLVILGLIVRNFVIRPISELARQVDGVAKGDFDRTIHVDRPAELETLSGHIDGMRREIVQQLQLSEGQATELRRSNSDLEQFAYVASHDLQEPLRKVASFTQLLEQRYGEQLDERAKQYITFTVDGAKRMQLLINDLLDFSRVGRMGGEITTLDSAVPLRAALHNLEAQIDHTDAVITHDPMPKVRGNRTHLTQLFQNLIGNALKFRTDATPAVHIGARQTDDGTWEFSCADNGIGIDAKYAERIFIIFQRLHPREAYPGTGIGLALCRKIVENHGGTIWVDTSASPGTTVRWTLRGADDA
ncbi:ATP-binding protein [Nonomuraea sp. NPDC050663]|uniref:sensor histidine kinase n=1 Tax=Nonomuraea sp. NPDC050663 TaxID=3364370 RepID=UPI0037B82F13